MVVIFMTPIKKNGFCPPPKNIPLIVGFYFFISYYKITLKKPIISFLCTTYSRKDASHRALNLSGAYISTSSNAKPGFYHLLIITFSLHFLVNPQKSLQFGLLSAFMIIIHLKLVFYVLFSFLVLDNYQSWKRKASCKGSFERWKEGVSSIITFSF